MNKQKGQAILILMLVMSVALSIGLSMVQKSLVDVSTSSKVEQSSRAFSAAEAGIEKALKGDPDCTNCKTFDDNSSTIKEVTGTAYTPAAATVNNKQDPLEYPPLAKEDIVQVWLADYTSDSNPPAVGYTQPSLNIYWGNSVTDKAALEVTLVYHDGTKYAPHKWYLDSTSTRNPANGFDSTANCPGYPVGRNSYQCKFTLNFSASEASGLMLIRARLLYNSTSQPIAVQAVGTCRSTPCTSYSLPAQAKWITSTGISGETQRKVKVFQLKNVVPPFFDYALFSAGEITK